MGQVLHDSITTIEAIHRAAGVLVAVPGDLSFAGVPIRGSWQGDRPELVVEFARESRNKRLTLVLVPEGPTSRALWSKSEVLNVDEARSRLGRREGIPSSRRDAYIGVWSTGGGECRSPVSVPRWANAVGAEAVVWTALPPKFGGLEGQVPSGDEVLNYLHGLEGPDRDRAKEYVVNAPAQIRTPYRELIETELGWIAAK